MLHINSQSISHSEGKMASYVDMLGFLNLPGPNPDVSQENIARLREARRSGLRLMHVTGAPPWCRNVAEAASHLNMFRFAYEEAGIITTVRDTVDLERVLADRSYDKDSTKIGVIWGLQGCPIDLAGRTISQQVGLLHARGCRIMGLAYDDATPFGCGWRAETTTRDTGLTDNGKVLIANMAMVGMILDLAHAGSRTALQAAQYAATVSCKVMISHTGAYRARTIKRNATDHVMDHVMDAGGLVCCYLLTFGLKSRNGSSLDIINRHITAMCGLRGVNYVGIGTDGCATGYPSREVWSQFFYILKDKLDPDGTFGARFPDQPDTPPGMLTPQRLVTLHNHLAEVCGPDNADKIMGDNAIRFLRSALPQAA